MLRANKTAPTIEPPWVHRSQCERSAEEGDVERDFGRGAHQHDVVRCFYEKAFLISLTLFGLFNPLNFRETFGRWRVPAAIYSTCAALFLLFNTLRVLATIFEQSDTVVVTFQKINYAAWLLLCTFNVGAFTIASCRMKGGIRRYYDKVARLVDRLRAVGVELSGYDRAWRDALPRLVVGWLFVIVNSVLIIMRLFKNGGGGATNATASAESDWLCRLRPSSDRNDSSDGGANVTSALAANGFVKINVEHEKLAMRYSMAVAGLLASGSWIWSVVYLVSVSSHLTKLFRALNDRISKLVALDRVALVRDIGQYRKLHRDACKCVEAADRYFRYVIGVHIVFNLLLSMMEIYTLVQLKSLRESGNADSLASYVLWLAAAGAMLTTECAAASVVAHESQETAEPLQKLADNYGEPNNHQLFQLQLFLNQLKEPSGFKVMGFFVLNKEGLLAIFGTWVTYFLIVLQFAPPLQA